MSTATMRPCETMEALASPRHGPASAPRVPLTKPSTPHSNNGLDNVNGDMIVCAEDTIASPLDGHAYDVVGRLGEGAYGVVVRCTRRKKKAAAASTQIPRRGRGPPRADANAGADGGVQIDAVADAGAGSADVPPAAKRSSLSMLLRRQKSGPSPTTTSSSSSSIRGKRVSADDAPETARQPQYKRRKQSLLGQHLHAHYDPRAHFRSAAVFSLSSSS